MSKYTTEVRFICESTAGYDESKGFDDVDTIISESIDGIFNFTFPIFDEQYRSVICSKILRHYYTREIGFETVGLWKLKLATKLNEIMPYYNKLYESELIKFNPLYDTDLQTTNVGNKDSENVKESNRSGISSLNTDHSESGSASKTNDSVEGENRNGNNSTDSSASSVSSTKNDSTKANGKDYSESGLANRTETGSTNDLYSDTPQGGLDGINSETYLTNARKINDGKNIAENNSKSGKTNETEVNSENGETSSFDSGNANSTFDEKTERTRLDNENTTNSRTVNDKSAKSDFENSKGTDKYNSTESYLIHVVGKQGGNSYSKLLKEFRETFLNIDMDVINSLSGLFMNLW